MPSSAGVRKNVLTTPTLIAVARSRAARAYIHIDNDSGKTIYTGVGNASVSTTTGRPLTDGSARTIVNTQNDSEATGAVYAVCAAGTASILVTEGT